MWKSLPSGRRSSSSRPRGGEGKWQISNGGGLAASLEPCSGKEIFLSSTGKCDGGAGAGRSLDSSPVFRQAPFSKPDLQYFDVEPDGEHFVLIESPGPTTETSLGVVVNWFSRISPPAAQAFPR